MKTEEEDTAKRSEEDEEQNTRKKDNAPKKHKEVEASEALTGSCAPRNCKSKPPKKSSRRRPSRNRKLPLLPKFSPNSRKWNPSKPPRPLRKPRRKPPQAPATTHSHSSPQPGAGIPATYQGRSSQGRTGARAKHSFQAGHPATQPRAQGDGAPIGSQRRHASCSENDNMTMPSSPSLRNRKRSPCLWRNCVRPPVPRPAAIRPTIGSTGFTEGNTKETILPVTSVQSATPAVSGVTPAQGPPRPRGVESHVGKIWDAVTTFRVRGENEMTVKVQPDNDTEMQLTIKYGNGGVEIEARMQQAMVVSWLPVGTNSSNNSPSAVSTWRFGFRRFRGKHA